MKVWYEKVNISSEYGSFVYNLSHLKKDFSDFFTFLKNNKLTPVLCWFFLLLSYGIKLFYYSISIDTECIINNYDQLKYGWFSINRPGLVITKRLFSLLPFNPYVANLLMLCAVFVFLMLLSFIFYRVAKRFELKPKCVFVLPCIFITHPLFVEQFNFTLQAFEVSFAISLMFLSVFFSISWIFAPKNFFYAVLGIVTLSFSFLHYQAIVFLYVSIVLSVFLYVYINNLKNPKGNLNRTFFRTFALKYIFTFFVSFLIYFICSKAVSLHFNLDSSYTDRMVTWGKIPLKSSIKAVFFYIRQALLGDGLFYSKIFLVAVLVSLIYFLKFLFFKNQTDRILYIFASLALIGSPFFLPLILGNVLVPRMQFSYQFFVAFVVYMLLQETNRSSFARSFLVLSSLYISFNQGYKVANLLYTDYMKYQGEIALAGKIDERISSLDLENIKDVPVAFVGGLRVSGTPNPTSGDVINLSFFYADRGTAFDSSLRILGLMKTVGYNYKAPSNNDYLRAKEIAKNMKAWPSPHAVKYEKSVVVVKLPE